MDTLGIAAGILLAIEGWREDSAALTVTGLLIATYFAFDCCEECSEEGTETPMRSFLHRSLTKGTSKPTMAAPLSVKSIAQRKLGGPPTTTQLPGRGWNKPVSFLHTSILPMGAGFSQIPQTGGLQFGNSPRGSQNRTMAKKGT